MASILDIYEDLLLRIFLDHPIETLCLLQVVCKRWHCLISSSAFIDDHLNPAKARRSFQLQKDARYNQFSLYDYASKSRRVARVTIECVKKNRGRWVSCSCDLNIVGAIQGVACFAATEIGKAVLWNPSIHKYLKIDIPSRNSGDYILGFGFCSSNNDFKLVRIEFVEEIIDGSPVMKLTMNYEVFSLEDDCWRKGLIADNLLSRHQYITNTHVLINGNIHWCVTDKPSDQVSTEVSKLLVFDFEREEFSTLKVPDDFLGFNGWVVKRKGRLSVFQNEKDLWVMREYGLDNTWLKLRGRDRSTDDEHVFEESLFLLDLKDRIVSSSFNKSSKSHMPDRIKIEL